VTMNYGPVVSRMRGAGGPSEDGRRHMWALAVVAGALVVLLVRWRRSGRTLDEYLALAVTHLYVALWHRWSSNGRAPLPRTGPALLIANHTCSAHPTLLVARCDRLISLVVARAHY